MKTWNERIVRYQTKLGRWACFRFGGIAAELTCGCIVELVCYLTVILLRLLCSQRVFFGIGSVSRSERRGQSVIISICIQRYFQPRYITHRCSQSASFTQVTNNVGGGGEGRRRWRLRQKQLAERALGNESNAAGESAGVGVAVRGYSDSKHRNISRTGPARGFDYRASRNFRPGKRARLHASIPCYSYLIGRLLMTILYKDSDHQIAHLSMSGVTKTIT
ncbi:hypothetical protein J6590_062760 [Homalodisca vitripennis]|nr:hypothetical protein J6590_062760 [Homalodisca vitripennis]